MKKFMHLGSTNSCSLKEGGPITFLCLSEGCEERDGFLPEIRSF